MTYPSWGLMAGSSKGSAGATLCEGAARANGSREKIKQASRLNIEQGAQHYQLACTTLQTKRQGSLVNGEGQRLSNSQPVQPTISRHFTPVDAAWSGASHALPCV
ncbi:hypothetical protein PSPO01_04091 [Paraphaeosphaeria sporulosa]